jgi:putative DNA methylase
MNYKKKLIEVALPLEAINKASAREKSIRYGHPSTLHLWWARRPLAAARAVIFAQMVDDPSAHPDLFPTEKKQEKERQRLFRIIEELVKWENTTNEAVLQQARDEIWSSWRRACAGNADHPRAKELFDRHKLPAFHDPFAGGGALPLEAQRLGLEAYASDLNPVAVLINKAMIEIPPKFAGRPPVNPNARQGMLPNQTWKGATGLAKDVRYYGKWMRDEAEKRIGHLYPKVEITAEIVKERPDLKNYMGKKLTVIAWLWARTVKSPNPAFAQVDVPLVSTFMLSTKAGKEVWVEPVIHREAESAEQEAGRVVSSSTLPASRFYSFTVEVGKPPPEAKEGTKLGRGANFRCVLSGAPIAGDHIKAEGRVGRMGARLMAVVAKGDRGRVYLSPTPEHEAMAEEAKPEWTPEGDTPSQLTGGGAQANRYGLKSWRSIFTERQLVALTTLCDLVAKATERVRCDAAAAGLPEDGAKAYAEAVGVYLVFVIEKLAEAHSTICTWSAVPKNELVVSTFRRQALPMTWDFAEANPFADSSGSIAKTCDAVSRVVAVALSGSCKGSANQADAPSQTLSCGKVVSTDPPYYDNIPYADLSDFFYVWLRHSLRPSYPDLFATVAVPKAEELVATSYRHGSREIAEKFFLDGMTRAMHRLAGQAHPAFPVTIYYAFKQSEGEADGGTASTGWETFLDAVIRAGFALTGTWPMRTERAGRSTGIETNALASSIVLVCRPRPDNAPTATRREFLATLKAELPDALKHLQRGNIAPVDLAQAAIGPGMAVYTRYAKVVDAEGKPLSVREALALINKTLDEALAEQEGDFDVDSRFALAWFRDHGFSEGPFGDAHTYFLRFNTAENALKQAGIIESGRGKVRLYRPKELPADWDPATDTRVTAWETVHQLIRVLEASGEGAAAALVAKLGSKAETARELCYRLYILCDRKKRVAEAFSYNGLVQSFPEIVRLAREGSKARAEQGGLFKDNEE